MGPVAVTDRDEDLLARQRALQQEAAEVLGELNLTERLAGFGPPLMVGSFVSGLMVWRELDIMFLGGASLSPTDLLAGLARLVEVPGVVGFNYADERGSRSPTGEVRDERYHVATTYVRAQGTWQLDLTFWLHDAHENLIAWHETLPNSLTAHQRQAILRIKDVWHRRPEYPHSVGSSEIYNAVLDDGVRTPQEFERWLARAPTTALRERGD
jgi:hypothetical protein